MLSLLVHLAFDLYRRETDALTLVEQEAVLRGPLWTLHRVARKELGGPVLQRLLDLAGGLPRGILASWIGFRVFVIGAPGLIIFGLLSAVNSALRASWGGWAWIAAAGLMLVSAIASALTFSLAMAKTRAILSRHFARWSYEDIFWWCALAIVVPAVGFAAVSSLLIHHQWIGFTGVQATDPNLGFRTFELFVWNHGEFELLRSSNCQHAQKGSHLSVQRCGFLDLLDDPERWENRTPEIGFVAAA